MSVLVSHAGSQYVVLASCTHATRPGKIPFADQSFDTVLLNDVLHHVENCEILLGEAKRVAKRQILVFEDQASWITRLIDVVFNYVYAAQMPCPLKFKTRQEWMDLFAHMGLRATVLAVSRPVWWPITHLSFQLQDCLDV